MRAHIIIVFSISILSLMGICMACSSDSESSDSSGIELTKNLNALDGTEMNTFCSWASSELGTKTNPKSSACTTSDGQRYVRSFTLAECKAATAPTCQVGAAEACINLAKGDLCKLLTEEACASFTQCAPDYAFQVHEQPFQGINAF